MVKEANMTKRLARSHGPGKLRKDPSLSQDELNKRAEAFINKFKVDMRLQRKESLNRIIKMKKKRKRLLEKMSEYLKGHLAQFGVISLGQI
ncbi:hypothetical protein AgCh_029397 [Apium graveolens]